MTGQQLLHGIAAEMLIFLLLAEFFYFIAFFPAILSRIWHSCAFLWAFVWLLLKCP